QKETVCKLCPCRMAKQIILLRFASTEPYNFLKDWIDERIGPVLFRIELTILRPQIAIIVHTAARKSFFGKFWNNNQYFVFFGQLYPVVTIGICISVYPMHDKKHRKLCNLPYRSVIKYPYTVTSKCRMR